MIKVVYANGWWVIKMIRNVVIEKTGPFSSKTVAEEWAKVWG